MPDIAKIEVTRRIKAPVETVSDLLEDVKRTPRWNPLVFIVLCGLSIFDAYALAVVVTRARRVRVVLSSGAVKKSARMIIIVALALNWIYLLVNHRA